MSNKTTPVYNKEIGKIILERLTQSFDISRWGAGISQERVKSLHLHIGLICDEFLQGISF